MAFDAIRPLVDEQRLDIRTEAVEERIGARHLTPRVDACYELVGRVRRLWKGFSGGDEAWSEIEAFFATVRRRGTAEATGEFG
jgi:Family of unknown function (DUF5947)